ncbi:uncharacterized protein BKA55DRAFT_555161 [Fusarium redolens]|uniref:Uncharacterized protein n=1 Tax=Fusarium redolens TaxID=48865 RepID=A0A9P9KRR1_FUSRE|nr:uncharacterized protein BKA55DRAFT_555161 [Fusarium redolens]KAH7267302.1 hypothetical protein BKA55DRAFT_555161 [Fusarium redolens]
MYCFLFVLRCVVALAMPCLVFVNLGVLGCYLLIPHNQSKTCTKIYLLLDDNRHHLWLKSLGPLSTHLAPAHLGC